MLNVRKSCRGLLSGVALLPLALGLGAAAQTTPDHNGTDEIIVTATRRAEPLSKVPESVSVATAETMQEEGVKSFADLARFTPGVDFTPDSNAVSIRGIKSNAGSATTGIYIDDTPIQLRALGFNANSALPAVYDLDRVEVLRGPQGTLFGAGSEGGTVRYITPEPSLIEYSGSVHAELAGTQGGGISDEEGAAVGGPIVQDKLGMRLAVWNRRDSGYIDQVDSTTGQTVNSNSNGTETYTIHGAVAWKPVDNLTITPSYNFEQRDQNNYNQYWVGLSDNSAGTFSNGTPEKMEDHDRFHLSALKIDYDLGAVSVISNTSYFLREENVNGYSGTLYNLSFLQQYTSSGIDPQGNACTNNCTANSQLLLSNGFNLPGFGKYESVATVTNSQRVLTQELRAQSNNADSWLTWTGGIFYMAETQHSLEQINDPQLPALTQYLFGEDMLTAWGQTLLPNGDDYVNDTTGHDMQVAGFGEVSVKPLDGVTLTAGLRYAYTHFDYHNVNTGAQDLLDDGGLPAYASGGKDERPVTPKFSASYQINPDDMIYTTIAKGYRMGGATPPLPEAACGGVFPTSYNSDTTWSYEAGTKDRFFDRKVQVSASAYYIQWNNIQQNIDVTKCGIQYTANVGNAVSKGFDFQADWQVMDGLKLESTVGYTTAEFTGDVVDPANPGSFLARKGDALDVAPWTVAMSLEYGWEVAGYDAFVRGDWELKSRRNKAIAAEDPNTEYYDAGLVPDPTTNFVSLRTGLIIDKTEINLFCDNLLNAHPQLALQHQDKYTDLYTAETFRPRTIGITGNYRF
jgi:outer membrane receptor protein involved in Fe transport